MTVASDIVGCSFMQGATHRTAMNVLNYFKQLANKSASRVRIEGVDVNGDEFRHAMHYPGKVDTLKEHSTCVDFARSWLVANHGINAKTLRINGAYELHPELKFDSKVEFAATLEDGREVTGTLPCEGLVPADAMGQVFDAICNNVRVRTGKSCASIRVLSGVAKVAAPTTV